MDTSSIIDAHKKAFAAPHVVRPPKKKKSTEERKAIREKKIIQSERASLHHVETALRKYNRANTTTVMPLLLESTLDRVVVDRVGDELDQEKYLAVSMVRPRSSMEAAHRQRRAM